MHTLNQVGKSVEFDAKYELNRRSWFLDILMFVDKLVIVITIIKGSLCLLSSDMVLRTAHFHSHNNLRKPVLLLAPFYRWGAGTLMRLSGMPRTEIRNK